MQQQEGFKSLGSFHGARLGLWGRSTSKQGWHRECVGGSCLGAPGSFLRLLQSSLHHLLQTSQPGQMSKDPLSAEFNPPVVSQTLKGGLCQQPEGEGKVCCCVAMSRNGGTGPASAPATHKVYLHL